VGLLESAAAHIAVARRKYNSEVSKAAQSQKLTETADLLNKAQEKLESDQEHLRETEHQVEGLARRFEEADKRPQAGLMEGDEVALARQRELAKQQQGQSRASEDALKGQHRAVLQDELLSLAMLETRLTVGFDELVKLHDAGIIPSGSVPVLAERLQLE